MSSRSKRGTIALAAGAALAVALIVGVVQRSGPTLRVCADPNNLPFSNRDGGGLENRLAVLLAHHLREGLSYTWWAERRGFLRETLGAGRCDVVLGIPLGAPDLLTTRPYYFSSYALVARRGRFPNLRSLDDPALAGLRIGLHVIGDDYNSLPPALALARRGLVHNIVGFSIYGDYAKPNPPADLIAAVASGKVDLAIAWGPLAGYSAARSSIPLDVRPLTEADAAPGAQFVYGITVGVRPDREGLRDSVQVILDRNAAEVGRLLAAFHVPVVRPGHQARPNARRAPRTIDCRGASSCE
jgi:quinoprotein dehydrogenase-associated probable ABC transporter substrate-binding protein